VTPVREYEVGLLYRWLFPDCVLHWLSAPRSPRRICRRVRRTFGRHGARRSITRVRWGEGPWLAYRGVRRLFG
jgi:hypothetical protein